ncbi:MAG: lipid kinase [Pseudomonadota bacterium]
MDPNSSQPDRRLLVVANPKARRGAEALERVPRLLADAGITAVVDSFACPTEVSPDIERRAPDLDGVVVCGGDGTINAAALGLMRTGLPLGIVPLGTANDLARTLAIPLSLEGAIEVVVAGHSTAIDAGTVNGHPFFNVASLGLSAELARTLDGATKRRWGQLGYAWAALRVLVRARRFRATITEKGATTQVRSLQIAVGNGRHYGGGNVIEAEATIDDGHLDLYSLELSAVWKLVLMAPAFRTGNHGAWSEVRTARCVEFDVITKRPMPINTDGELVTFTPARFQVHPKAVKAYVPAG